MLYQCLVEQKVNGLTRSLKRAIFLVIANLQSVEMRIEKKEEKRYALKSRRWSKLPNCIKLRASEKIFCKVPKPNYLE